MPQSKSPRPKAPARKLADRRSAILDRLERAWRDFEEAHAGLSDEDMLRPGVTGLWSVRDLLAHVTWWEEEALKHLPLILRGGTPPRYKIAYGGIDAFNALLTERKKSLSLRQVRDEHAATHRRLVAYLESVPEDQFRSAARFSRRLRLDTYAHYPLHAAAIRKWRSRLARHSES